MASLSQSPVNSVDIAKLRDKNIDPQLIKFGLVTISSEEYVCVSGNNTFSIVDLKSKSSPTRVQAPADSAVIHPKSKVVAVRSGTTVSFYSSSYDRPVKTYTVPSASIVLFKWIDADTLGVVTDDAVYCISYSSTTGPVKMFARQSHPTPIQVLDLHMDSEKKWVLVCGLTTNETGVCGALQVYSAEAKASQPIIDAPAACFATTLLDGRPAASNLLCFVMKKDGKHVLTIRELGATGGAPFSQIIPISTEKDVPVSILADSKYGVVYILTKNGFAKVYEIQSGACLFDQQITSITFFTSCNHSNEGILAVDLHGRIVHITLNTKNLVPHVINVLKNPKLGIEIARRYNLEGADHIFQAQFDNLMATGQHSEAVQLLADSPGTVIRNINSIERLRQIDPKLPLQYFQTIINKPTGKLNKIESVELAKLLVTKGKDGVDHISKWITDNKVECSEELGEVVRRVDPLVALSIFFRSEAKDKCVSCLLQLGASAPSSEKAAEHFENIVQFAKKYNFTPNYLTLVQQIVSFNPDRAKEFALVIIKSPSIPAGSVDVNQITDIFLRNNDVKNSTNILLEYLSKRGDLPEDATLQTKLLESNLHSMPQVANAIMDSEEYKFTHYDRLKIAQLCERAQLYQRALEHYTDVSDIKRILGYCASVPLPQSQFVVDFFGTLSQEVGLELLQDLLKQNLSANIRVVVEAAKKWTELYTAEKLIALFEEVKSFNGLYFFLGSFVNFTSNPNVVFKYVEAASRIGASASKEIERICRENNHYDPKQIKDFLIEQSFTTKDPRALIHVCLRFNYVDELITYLYNNQLHAFIEAFVQKKAPQTAPLVFGVLLDLNATESEITKLLDGLRAPPTHEDPDWLMRLADAFEARTRLRLLRNWLEARLAEGSTDTGLHTALAKLHVDTNTSSAKHFLENNNYYDTLVVGKFCESRDPTLAVIVYRKGKNDAELIDVTNKNGFFKDQARYLVSRMDLDVWALVLNPDNANRRPVIDQVVATALNEAQTADEVSVAVKAFMAADLPNELMELLERLMLHSGDSHHRFSENKNLQNLLILTAIKADPKRVMDYIKRLDKYDTEKIASTCLQEQHQLYEEAFYIYKKQGQTVDAARVLIENIKDMSRAEEYASLLDTAAVWSLLARSYLDNIQPIEAMKYYIKAQDSSAFRELINSVNASVREEKEDPTSLYNALIDYLRMARNKTKDALIDSELLFALAYTHHYHELDEAVQSPTSAKLVEVGDRIYEAKLYEAARIIYNQISNYTKLAMTLIKLELWQEAVDAARKAKATTTWKLVCFACVDAGEFRFAQVCGLNVIGVMEHLMDLIAHYEKHCHFSELITLLEAGVNLERTHQGIFTQLGVCYAKYREEKMMEHIKLFHNRSNIAQLITACRENMLWPEAVFLTQQYEQYETAVDFMIDYSPVAWKNDLFKDILSKCTNTEIFYRAIDFYLSEHPLLLSDLLIELEKKLDHSRVVYKVRTAGHIPLVKSYLKHVQFNDITNVNEALHDLYIEENNHKSLRESILDHKAFDQNALAERLKKHDLLEFRRIAVVLYQKNERYERAIELAKKDESWGDAMQGAAASKNPAVAESLLRFFVEKGLREAFTATLYTCYEFIAPDLVLELAWKNGLTDFAMPYMIQTFATFNSRLANLEKRLDDQVKEKKEETKKREEEQAAAQDAVGLGLLPAPGGVGAPLMLTMAPPMGMPGQQYGMPPTNMGNGGNPYF